MFSKHAQVLAHDGSDHLVARSFAARVGAKLCGMQPSPVGFDLSIGYPKF